MLTACPEAYGVTFWQPEHAHVALLPMAMHALSNHMCVAEAVHLCVFPSASWAACSQLPVNVQVVPFGEADPEELYTLSSQGVTQHCGVVRCDFTSLAQWGREMLLFNGLKRLHIFGQYKLWKNLK